MVVDYWEYFDTRAIVSSSASESVSRLCPSTNCSSPNIQLVARSKAFTRSGVDEAVFWCHCYMVLILVLSYSLVMWFGNSNFSLQHDDHIQRSLAPFLQVRVEMRTSSGGFLKYIEYSASGTTKSNWFTSSKFSSSSWNDLHSGVTHNSWAMEWVTFIQSYSLSFPSGSCCRYTTVSPCCQLM